jgi:phosphocarrier protein
MSRAASLPANELGGYPPAECDDPAAACGRPLPPGTLSRCLPIVNKRGLHARASAKFVQLVERFDAAVSVCRNGEAVGGTSIMGLMMLAAGPGTSITVTARGREAESVLDALEALVGDRFGEEE